MASFIQISTFLSCIIFLHVLVVLHLIPNTFAQPEFLYYNCTYTANYTNPNTYNTNLNTTLSSLSTNIDQYDYYNSSIGQEPDSTAVALCQGDVELELCRACINDSISKLKQVCPGQKEAIGWYDNCMLRYTNQTIPFGTMDWGPGFEKWNDKLFVPDEFMNAFQELRRTLLLISQNELAASPSPSPEGSLRSIDSPDDGGSNDTIIYNIIIFSIAGFVVLIVVFVVIYLTKKVVIYLTKKVVIYLRKKKQRKMRQISTLESLRKEKQRKAMQNIDVDGISTLESLRKEKQRKAMQNIDEDGISTLESLQYDFYAVKAATNNFSETNKLGQGGFGPVYRGIFSNGKEFAVKRLSKGSGQGEVEFKNEVLLMARLQHRNLVRLMGFCLEGLERLLVYEFVINGSLDHFIFDTIKGPQLDWEKRYKIIGGIAKGLLYLHEDSRLRIIHRDLKAGNILLDADMNAKIADFGLARCFVRDETQGSTSKIAGTYGYMAPEVLQGHISVRSDVYSFGVLVLEIISGQKISKPFGDEENAKNLLSYAWKMWREGTASELIEPTMRYNWSSVRDIKRCIHIGLLCVQENVNNRPTMASVVVMLTSFSPTLPLPTAFLLDSSSDCP